MTMKRIVIGAGAVALAVGSLSAWAGYAEHRKGEASDPGTLYALATPSSDDVLVKVNGQPLTRGEVDREIDTLVGGQLAAIPAAQQAGVRDQLQGRVLDNLIVQKLLTQAVDQQKVVVGQEEIASSMRELAAALPEGKTMDDYVQAMGVSKEAFEKEIVQHLKVNKLLDKQVGNVAQPTAEEVLSFYDSNPTLFEAPENVSARHILIASKPSDEPSVREEKRKKAETLREELVKSNGANFAELAAQNSDCPSKAEGGNLGRLSHGEVVPAFEKAAFSQKVDEIGPVVETEFGYHVIQVQDHQAAGKLPFEKVKEPIAKQMKEERERAAVDKYIESLKSSASIEYQQHENA